MITGAGGSIGSQLCLTIAQWNPAAIVLFESSEFALYQIDRQLRQFASCTVVPVLGSVRDRACVEKRSAIIPSIRFITVRLTSMCRWWRGTRWSAFSTMYSARWRWPRQR